MFKAVSELKVFGLGDDVVIEQVSEDGNTREADTIIVPAHRAHFLATAIAATGAALIDARQKRLAEKEAG